MNDATRQRVLREGAKTESMMSLTGVTYRAIDGAVIVEGGRRA